MHCGGNGGFLREVMISHSYISAVIKEVNFDVLHNLQWEATS